MPDIIEEELYQHVVWLCENDHPASWDNIRAVAWQLGVVAGMRGEKRPLLTASAFWPSVYRTLALAETDIDYSDVVGVLGP